LSITVANRDYHYLSQFEIAGAKRIYQHLSNRAIDCRNRGRIEKNADSTFPESSGSVLQSPVNGSAFKAARISDMDKNRREPDPLLDPGPDSHYRPDLPDPTRQRYVHIGFGNETLRPVPVSEPVYQLVKRLMTEARKKAGNPC
jgi:hypothetical protein